MILGGGRKTILTLKPETRGTAKFKTREERTMLTLIKKLIRDEHAQDLAEYGIALAVIGAGAALAAVAIATDVNTLWSVANSIIGGAAAAV
jgi:Flp pilus assembly pilin Flp